MNTGTEEEFYASLIIYGAVLLVGLVLIIAFGFIAIAIRNRVKKNETVKQIYEQERKNGKSH